MVSGFKKISLGILLTFFAFVAISGSLLWPRPAKAQWVTMEASSVPATLKQVFEKIVEGLKVAVLNAAVQGVSYFMDKIAYDTAVYLASGGKGQEPLLFTDQWGDYLKDTAAEAGAKAVEELAKPLGLDLCKVPDINIDLALRLSLQDRFGGAGNKPQGPKCTFQDMKMFDPSAWESKYGGEDASKIFNFSVGFVEEGDLGIALSASEKIERLIEKNTIAAQLDRTVGQGVRAVENVISGKIETPQNVLRMELEGMSPKEKQSMSLGQFGSVMSTAMYQVIPSTLSTFLNTLLNQGMKNLVAGLFPEDAGSEESGTSVSTGGATGSYGASGVTGGRARAEKMYSELLLPKTTIIEKYNILADFANCPDSPAVNNCAMDTLFVKAAQEADYGKPITIKEAISKDWLHGSWKLIPPDNYTLNSDKNCYQTAYCYANIKKLRQARILPLGFEIATKNSNADKPWTLKEVVEGFHKCNYQKDKAGNIIGFINDPVNYPYCHLIDPDWVLKVPATRCEAMGYTNNLLTSAGPQRVKECVDTSTCVKYDSQGSCLTYGYCVREKNVWRVDGDKCDSQYGSCLAFKDSNSNIVSYLYRTLDTSFCNKDNVGCNAYSLNGSVASATSTVKWLPYSPTGVAADASNSMIYFNKNLSANSCASGSAGCSAFAVADTSAASSTMLYLKKAPAYLGCYDTYPDKPSVQWPSVAADLTRLKPHSDCQNYAQPCVPDEVNCNLYTEVVSSGSNRAVTAIPGKYTPATISSTIVTNWNDQCDKKCVGYDAYQELGSKYSNGQSLAYIIPSSGASCQSNEEGCTSFTNLSTLAGQLEKVEYFTYLRPCIKSDYSKQKTFYTYEGSTESGYQLKVYILEKDPLTGAPKQFFKTKAEEDTYKSCWDGQTYKIDPDCRQFNDDEGKIYYRLLSKTIAVDQNCSPYRLTKTELYHESAYDGQQTTCSSTNYGYYDTSAGKCYLCFQGGKYKDGNCFYEGLPTSVTHAAGNSQTCSATVNSCRAYKGNAGNNVKVIFKDTFDESSSTTVALADWYANTAGAISLSVVSTYVGGHSLGYRLASGSNSVYKFLNTTSTRLLVGRGYKLSFWAKADNSQKVEITMENSNTTAVGAVAVTDVWNYYQLGPIQLQGSGGDVKLHFKLNVGSTAANLFLDNVELIEINEVLYLVKDTLKVDPVCDGNLDDNLPGHALGCKAYTTPDKSTVYLTGFSYLCRENAIGCAALLDTYNTIGSISTSTGNNLGETEESWYNVWLAAKGGSTASIAVSSASKGKNTYSCSVPAHLTGCYVNITGYSSSSIKQAATASVKVEFVTSTVYIPADTPSGSPFYLVADKAATCNTVNLGCTWAGKETQTPTGPKYDTVLIKNYPADYTNSSKPILCQRESVGCNSYSSGNSTYYFKDPTIVGNKVCDYKSKVTINGIDYSGWFWKNVGACGTSTTAGDKEYSTSTKQYCTTDTDCSAIAGYGKCVNKGNQPCYPDYLKSGNIYDLWSFGATSSYQGFVGECPSSQSGCTAFVDRNDNDKAYYALDNSKLQTAKGGCSGQVSLKEGCVLFDQIDTPNKLWSTAMSYALSKSKNDALVAPYNASNTTAGTAVNDANVIMKVIRDRECGEWLQCRASYQVYDKDLNRYRSLCQSVGRCNELAVATDEVNNRQLSTCANWVDGSHKYAGQILTDNLYRYRDFSWKGMDFSGYSLLGVYPIEELIQINLGSDSFGTSSSWRLVKKISCGNENCATVGGVLSTTTYACAVAGQPCGSNKVGVCVSVGSASDNLCVLDPFNSGKGIIDTAPKLSCRSYPEEDSPYPNTKKMSESSEYQSANFCEESQTKSTSLQEDAYACDCDYTKVTYGTKAIVKYWNYANPVRYPANYSLNSLQTGDAPKGFCVGGTDNGKKACVKNADCDSNNCSLATQQSQRIGIRGYCLEYDYTRYLHGNKNERPCLTWYPVNAILGAVDLYSTPEAGYQVNKYGRYYCDESRSTISNATQADEIHRLLLMDHGATCYGNNITKNPVYCNPNKYVDYICHPKVGQGYKYYNKGETLKACYDQNNYLFGRPLWIYEVSLQGALSNPAAAEAWANIPFFHPENYDFDIKPASTLQKNINIRDVDQLIVKLHTLALKGNNDILPPGVANDTDSNKLGMLNNLAEYFVVRNGAVTDLRPVITEYTKNEVCKVYYVGDSNKKSVEQCGIKLASESNIMEVNRLAYGDAITRVFKFQDPKDKKFKTAMRLIAADTNEYGSPSVPKYLGLIGENNDNSLILFGSSTGKALCNTIRDGVDIAEVAAVFDDKGNFEYSAFAICSGGALKEKDRALYHADIKVDLRETCSRIADVTFSQNAAWTDRIWKRANYKHNYDYTYLVAESPFGALNLTNAPSVFDSLFYGFRQNEANSQQASLVGASYGCLSLHGVNCAGAVSNNAVDFEKINYKITGNFSLLRELFARVNKIFLVTTTISTSLTSLSSPDNYYYRPDTTTNNIYNYTEALSDFTKAPQIRWVDTDRCDTKGEKCQEGKEGVTINKSYNKDVLFYSQPAKIDLKFFAYADPNQMPITQIKVDWGDGFQTVRQGSFRNKRGGVEGSCDPVNKICTFANVKTAKVCVDDYDCKNLDYCQPESRASHFGQIADVTCDNDYYLFSYVYQCDQYIGSAYNPPGSKDCPSNMSNGCCIFKPKVQVKDNWGWCNGMCVHSNFKLSCSQCDKSKMTDKEYNDCVSKSVCVFDSTAGGVGCYDGEWKKKAGIFNCLGINDQQCKDECYINTGAWTSSTIRVIVAPKE